VTNLQRKRKIKTAEMIPNKS